MTQRQPLQENEMQIPALDNMVNISGTARTIGEQVYQYLRGEILTLHLVPGTALSISDVAGELHVSRSPVRDAFMRLSTESLIDIFPQRGCRVSCIDMQRVQQEHFLRVGVEMRAVQCFVPIAAPCDFELMNSYLRKQEKALAAKDILALQIADDAFHDVFFDAIHQDFAKSLLRTRCVHYDRIRLLSALYSDTVPIHILGEHRAILESVQQGDTARCLELDDEHLNKLDDQYAQMRSRFPSYFLLMQGDAAQEK